MEEFESKEESRVLTLIDKKISEKSPENKKEENKVNNELLSKLENLEIKNSYINERIEQIKAKKSENLEKETENQIKNEKDKTILFEKKEEITDKQENVKINNSPISEFKENTELKNENKENIQLKNETKEIENKKNKENKGYRRYIVLSAICLIFVLTLSWFVYNTVKINQYKANLQTIETQTNAKSFNIKKLISELNKLNTNEELKDQATAMSPLTEKIENPTDYELTTNDVYKGETNFYDKICRFFSKLFGG